MIMEGAGVCPLVKVGDIVGHLNNSDDIEGRVVTRIVCDRNNAGSCSAFRTLALIIFREGLEVGDAMNPGIADSVNCNSCPVLANDPDHKSKTKDPYELIKEALARGDNLTEEHEEPKDIEPVPSKPECHDRFELIDITEEEDPEES